MNVLLTTSMDVKEMLLPQEIILTQFNQLELELLNPSASNMEDQRLKQNYQRETGSGLQFGSYLSTMNMETGQQVEKSISWNQEEMMLLTLLRETTFLDQLFTSDQAGNRMDT